MKKKEKITLKDKLMRLEKRMMDYPELREFYGGVSIQNILWAQEELKLIFPVSYRWFLLTFGAGNFGDFEIFGLMENDNRTIRQGMSAPDVIWMTRQMRSKFGLPEEYIPIWGDGVGGYYCIKVSEKNYEDAEMYFLYVDSELPEFYYANRKMTDFFDQQIKRI